MDNCQFCEIIEGKWPAHKWFQDSEVIVFDSEPKYYPVHMLIVPVLHIPSLRDIHSGTPLTNRYHYATRHTEEHLMGKLLIVASSAARWAGISDRGYRIVINNGEDAIQKVHHLHLHVLGGERMDFEPREARP